MSNQIKDKNKCKKCLDFFSNDCFYKLFNKNIIAIDESQSLARQNKKLLTDMTLEQRIIVINSMDEIINYNSDFNEIIMNYLLDFRKIPNSQNFFQLIKSQYSYYYYKAIIKSLLILIQLIIILITFYPKYECIDSQIKIKYAIWILKLIYFLFFDFAYILNEFYFFKQLERKKFNKKLVGFYQIIAYILNGIIYFLIFFNNNNCDNADIVFFIKDKYLKIITSILFDLVKYFIK
jgi:hypothetical protein